MESTGVYWVPLYEILESRGLEVYLVNAQQVKNVSGRKSDVSDCQWLQQLHTYGLLSASFRPPEQIVALRSLVRQREMLVRYRASHIQHMQKALELMNLKLSKVLSDITGQTGMQIIRAILVGERDPQVLAAFRDGRCKYSSEEIAKALTGHYKREQVFALKQAVEMYDYYGEQIRACDAELEALYAEFDPPDEPGSPPPAPKRNKRRKNQAYFDLAQSLYRLTGVDLTAVDGLDALTVQDILTETGTDMSKWKTVKHFAAWLRLAPNNKVTGGKVKQRGTLPTQNRANTALRLAAQSLARSDSALGAFYRRIRTRHGPAVAVTATAHKIARIIYHMLKHREPYHDLGADHYDQQHKERLIRNLQRRAAKLGMQLAPLPG
jgi:transposase